MSLRCSSPYASADVPQRGARAGSRCAWRCPIAAPRILTIDIETSPNLADVWGLWQQNVGITQLRQSTRMMCFAAKWHGEREVIFKSEFHDGYLPMVKAAHALLDEADVLVHFNGNSFDVPHLMREFLQADLGPPSPFDNVDLLRAVKKKFRFPSNKLDYVSQAVGFKGKVKHEGHTLWVKCMAGDEAAWGRMRRYNIGDVRLTERLYDRLLPWIPAHPHVGLYRDPSVDCCSRCGSDRLQRRGMAYTKISAYQRWQCQGCGAWGRSGRREAGVDVRGV